MSTRIAHFVSPDEYAENAYLLVRENSRQCLVVDPGTQFNELLAAITHDQLELVAILNTHGHADHIAGNAAVKQAWPQAPLLIGQGDADMLLDPTKNLSAFVGKPFTSPPADQTLEHGQQIAFADLEFEVREIPGHSPGHVVFVNTQDDTPFVIGGDCLFAGGIGRFDFPGGNGRLLIQGIRDHLFSLPPETRVYPGHGPDTTVGEERATNPFLQRGAQL